MFSWLIDEPYKTIWLSLAALATVVGVLYTIFRRKNSGKTNIITSSNKSTAIGKVDATAEGESKQTVITGTVNIGITLEQHEASLRHLERRLREEIQTAVETEEREKRAQLEIELNEVNDRSLNLQKSFEEEQRRRESAYAALDKLE